ncbi:putative pickpocket, partial [Operophtera brumata]
MLQQPSIEMALRELTHPTHNDQLKNQQQVTFKLVKTVWVAAVVTIRGYYNHYHTNTIRFTTRNDYLHWNPTFASVTVCEIANVDKIWSIGKQLGSQYNDKLDRFIGDIAFFTGTCFSCLSTCFNESMCSTDYAQMASFFHTSCEEFFVSCKWNDNPINCCKHFKPLQTEYGRCFSINNRHTEQNKEEYVTSVNRSQLGIIEITLTQDYEAFLHSPEDIPFWNMEYDRRTFMSKRLNLNINFNGHPIRSATSTKFLGMIIDKNCTWKLHIKSVCGKLNSLKLQPHAGFLDFVSLDKSSVCGVINFCTRHDSVNGTQATVSDFTTQLSQLYERHSSELQVLVANFRKRNSELRKER